MKHRVILLSLCCFLFAAATWLGVRAAGDPTPKWTEIAPGVHRSPGPTAGYALVDGGSALLIDAPLPRDQVMIDGGVAIDAVLLTHYHRPVCQGIDSFLAAKIPVRSAPKSNEWLERTAVAKFWKESLPLRSSRTAYLVAPVGYDGIDYTLEAGKKFAWKSWSLEVIDAPGHSRTGIAILAQRSPLAPREECARPPPTSRSNGDRSEPARDVRFAASLRIPLAEREGYIDKRLLFVGGAIAAPGKIFAPYTTDWDHWTDAGLKPAAQTLDGFAALTPDIVCPSYGPIIAKEPVAALRRTATALREAGFLKSFERFTKQRLGNPPDYPFLAREQVESNGSKPWSRVSEHLYLTGNTYVLVSKDGPCLMIDPWGVRSVEQWGKLREGKMLGPLEVVWFSHAHNDHYDGVYDLPKQDTFETWTLDLVAAPLVEPLRWRAPFLDPRPVRIDKRPRDGETQAWREYKFRFHHLPGQSLYTMGVETVIDGKKCFFTADNYYHQDMFAGTGGWMGLNRAFPPYYAASAKKVLDAAPDWILAEHGGPFAFDAEDWRRRIAWADAAGKALDEVSVSGRHLHDYNPHQLHVEPLVVAGKPGGEVRVALVGENALSRAVQYEATINGRGIFADRNLTLRSPAGTTARLPFTVRLPKTIAPGRHVFAVSATESGMLCPADAFFVVDVAE